MDALLLDELCVEEGRADGRSAVEGERMAVEGCSSVCRVPGCVPDPALACEMETVRTRRGLDVLRRCLVFEVFEGG